VVPQHASDGGAHGDVESLVSAHGVPCVCQLEGAEVLHLVVNGARAGIFDERFEEVDAVGAEPEMLGEVDAHGTLATTDVQHASTLDRELERPQEIDDHLVPSPEIPQIGQELRDERQEIERDLEGLGEIAVPYHVT
jgi:hypothetical protein